VRNDNFYPGSSACFFFFPHVSQLTAYPELTRSDRPCGELTPAVVKAATDEKKSVFIWDTSLPGFGLRVTAAGRRSWPVQYKRHGVSRRRNLPGVLDLSAQGSQGDPG
jgi:hypothetical protein